jgi:hypothetical protein
VVFLSFRLAEDFGLFRITKGPGRHPSWSIEKHAKLLDEVDEIKANYPLKRSRKMRTSEAVEKLRTNYPKVTAKTLINQYKLGKNRSARLVLALVKGQMAMAERASSERASDAAEDGAKQKILENQCDAKEQDTRLTFGLAEIGRLKTPPGK